MEMQIEAIASMTGMSGIFKLRAADIYRVLSVEKLPYPDVDRLRHPMAKPSAGALKTQSELARKTAEFQILQRVSADINSTLDLDEICDVALRTMDELFEFHHANILLLEPDGQTLKVVASRGYENQAIGGRVQIGTGVIGVVAQKRKMLRVSNLGQQRAYAAAQRRETMKSGLQANVGETVPVPGLANAESQIAIPLLIRDELIGVFSIESPVPRSFGEHERDLVSIVANQIASAIHNARLYEERRRRPWRCRKPTRRSKRGSPNGPRRSNASFVSRRHSSAKHAAASRVRCSATAPRFVRCARRSRGRPRRPTRFC